MVELKRAENDFPLPKVRDSFIHQFATDGDDNETDDTSGMLLHVALFCPKELFAI